MNNTAKIVIVEDEAIIALTLTSSLTKLGYSVIAHFASGEDFVEYIRKVPQDDSPDLVLMDIMLSGKLDGIETIEIIKKTFDIPVIYLTALSNDSILQKAKITEPYAYILKPFNERELHISIEIALYKFKSELRIKKSEQNFRDIFNSINSVFYKTNLEGTIEMISPSVKTIFDYDPEKLVGKKTSDFYLNPNDREQMMYLLKKNGFVNNFETKLQHPSGHIFEVSADIKYWLNEQNEPIGLIGILKDITQLNKFKQDAKNYLDAIEQSNEMIVITDKNGIMQFVNNNAETVTGYSKNEMLGKNPKIFKSGILSSNFYKKIWEDLNNGKMIHTVFPNKTKKGKLYYEEKIITPIRNSAGEIYLFISTGRDITDKIKTKRKIELLSHSIRLKEAETNRNIIKSFIQGQEEERKRVSKEIHDGLCQILSIAKMSLIQKNGNRKMTADANLNELIDASITEAKRIANNLSPAVLSDFGLAAGLKKLVLINSINTNIKIYPRISGIVPRLSAEIELALFRIAQEAISNAMQHSRCNKVIMQLYCSGGYVVLCIIDNGKGIEENKKTKIYGGLGMSNMTQRAKLIGAELEIKSKQNKYTSILVKYNLKTRI